MLRSCTREGPEHLPESKRLAAGAEGVSVPPRAPGCCRGRTSPVGIGVLGPHHSRRWWRQRGFTSLPQAGRARRAPGREAGILPSSGCWVPPAPPPWPGLGKAPDSLQVRSPRMRSRNAMDSVGSRVAGHPRTPRGRVDCCVPCDRHRGLWAPLAGQDGLQGVKPAQNQAWRGIFSAEPCVAEGPMTGGMYLDGLPAPRHDVHLPACPSVHPSAALGCRRCLSQLPAAV